MNADCLCGGIRIEVSGKVGPVVYCHCSRCRKASGTAFGANADVRRKYWRFLTGDGLIREFGILARGLPRILPSLWLAHLQPALRDPRCAAPQAGHPQR